MMKTTRRIAEAGFDGIALKPTTQPPDSVDPTAVDSLVIDFEGDDSLPSPDAVAETAAHTTVVVTTPVRSDGFDPLGDDRLFAAYAPHARFALVAGNGAYLHPHERRRAIAPRLAEAIERYPDALVGTEGIERIALATGAAQFELLGPRTASLIRGLRAAGFTGDIAVYTPAAVTDDRQAAIDWLSGYLRRRRPVQRALDNAGDSSDEQRVLDQALDNFALVGDTATVNRRIDSLKAVGATAVIGHPVTPN